MDNNRLISLLSECQCMSFFLFRHNIAVAFAAFVTHLQVVGGLVCSVAVGYPSGALGSGRLKPAGCSHCLCFGPRLFLALLLPDRWRPATRPRRLDTGWEVGGLCCGFRSTLNPLSPVYSPPWLSFYSFALLPFFFFSIEVRTLTTRTTLLSF